MRRRCVVENHACVLVAVGAVVDDLEVVELRDVAVDVEGNRVGLSVESLDVTGSYDNENLGRDYWRHQAYL